MQAAADGARPRDRERHLAVLGAVRGAEAYTRGFLKIRPGGYLKRTPASLPGGLRFVVQRTENDAGAAATCIHCAACVPVCPTLANLEFKQEDARLITTDQARCIGCGTCVEICPANLANGGRTLRVFEAPTLEWVQLVRAALAAGAAAPAIPAAPDATAAALPAPRAEEAVR
jgi:ferredoxin